MLGALNYFVFTRSSLKFINFNNIVIDGVAVVDGFIVKGIDVVYDHVADTDNVTSMPTDNFVVVSFIVVDYVSI